MQFLSLRLITGFIFLTTLLVWLPSYSEENYSRVMPSNGLGASGVPYRNRSPIGAKASETGEVCTGPFSCDTPLDAALGRQTTGQTRGLTEEQSATQEGPGN